LHARVIEHLIFPLFAAWIVGATWVSLDAGLPSVIVTMIVIVPTAIAAFAIERLWPARPEFVPLDQPARIELAHFLLNNHFGYLLAIVAWMGLDAILTTPVVWPFDWPLPLQVCLALCLAEGVSYWQHRAFHHVPWLWRFHALHHRGERLNLARAGRFHFVDIGAAAFTAYVPLALLHAPEPIIGWTTSVIGALGIPEHANIRMRTPAWLERWICTPSVHRVHHSRDARHADSNYGTSVMIWDRLLGTYVAPRGEPTAIGVEGEPLTGGFFAQVFKPFRSKS
jgi:sterol desaturase/sphingolipid hydroxylase (fatty acid hydroxylase superfamily)